MTIFTDKEIKTFKNAIKVFGKHPQLDMVMEESAELIQSVNKFKRKSDSESLLNLAAECADVLIMIEQVSIMYDLESEINRFVEIKAERLKNTIGL